MRFLGIGETCDLGALYRALIAEGHEVRVCVTEPLAQGTLQGLVPTVADWRAELPWLREGPDLGIILFESVSEGFGAIQDDLRRDGYSVVGGSAYGDRLENDRAFAQATLADLGFVRSRVWDFPGPAEALDHVAARPDRYVLKVSGADHAASDTYVGRLADGRDVAAMLRVRAARGDHRPLILMEHLDGVEMGVGAYFDGARFLEPACLDWEHKRFFAGDLGELTGEMGTVVTYARTTTFFERTLKRMAPGLAAGGYCGYVNLNTIVNEAGIWPLEFTCRFGYPGYAILAPLQETSWGELFRAMVTRSGAPFRVRPGFCAGIVLTTPPFPYSRHEVEAPVGLPVLLDPADAAHLHYGEVGLDDAGQLVTSGLYGWTLVVTGVGDTVAAAKGEAYARTGRVLVPDARYRLDIGDRLIGGDLARVEALGLLDPWP
jgi:phosphoribosylamine---glycine ligase